MGRVLRDDCPALGLTCRHPHRAYTCQTRAPRHSAHRPRSEDSDRRARYLLAPPDRALPTASDHSPVLYTYPPNSYARPVARPGLHICAPRHRLAGRRVPNESKLEELGRPLLWPCTASHCSPHCTHACRSTGTSHADTQRAQPSHQVM